jgi:hypothetical protein
LSVAEKEKRSAIKTDKKIKELLYLVQIIFLSVATEAGEREKTMKSLSSETIIFP